MDYPDDPGDDDVVRDLRTGKYDPPVVSPGLTDAWGRPADVGRSIQLARLYADLLTPQDWQGACAGQCDPATIWDAAQASFARSSAAKNGATLDRVYDEGPLVGCNMTLDGAEIDPYQLGLAWDWLPRDGGGQYDPPKYIDDARIQARLSAYYRWCGWLTRNKIAMARLTQFGYSPDTSRYDDPDDYIAMAYDYISSLYRVNQQMYSGDTRGYVTSQPSVIAAYATMHGILAEFAAAVSITVPAGGAQSLDAAFPVSHAWWTGKLPAWGSGAGTHGVDTREISKRLREAAGAFRRAVGGAITLRLQMDSAGQ